MYREAIKVLDCTIRDGGLINDHFFEDNFVREVYRAIASSGVDYMEIGYKASKTLMNPDKFGKWKFCDEEEIKKAIDGIPSHTKLSVMVDVGRVEKKDILPKKDSVIDMMRVACYVKDIDAAIDLANDAADKGYETTVNLMAVSKAIETELEEALDQLGKECRAKVIYVVDSFGTFYCENITHLVNKYKQRIGNKEIGIHTHNNQQLAYGNTIQAIIDGANYLDASIFGIGRGAGNCPLELLLGFLKNPKFDLGPILEVIPKEFLPLQKKIEWGYIIPYALTGMFNEHPRLAIELRKGSKKDNYREFYESLQATEVE
ncbi:MAG: aldolase catalytic domain-containing protein [Candidatus Omnitrophica bacterium]|nr:aldolase catalytic domain-containing protein [Candidatus Omnitrophota bacterium]